jgi:hypothetical protein
MQNVDVFIHKNAPGSLVAEWAKREECWLAIQKETFDISFDSIKADMISKSGSQRRRQTEQEMEEAGMDINRERIMSIPHGIWRRVEEWGYTSNKLTQFQYNTAGSISDKLSTRKKPTDNEVSNGIKVLDIAISLVPELFHEIDDVPLKDLTSQETITIDLINKVVNWDKKAKKLANYEYTFMNSLVAGTKTLSEHNQKLALKNLAKAKKYGFK